MLVRKCMQFDAWHSRRLSGGLRSTRLIVLSVCQRFKELDRSRETLSADTSPVASDFHRNQSRDASHHWLSHA